MLNNDASILYACHFDAFSFGFTIYVLQVCFNFVHLISLKVLFLFHFIPFKGFISELVLDIIIISIEKNK